MGSQGLHITQKLDRGGHDVFAHRMLVGLFDRSETRDEEIPEAVG